MKQVDVLNASPEVANVIMDLELLIDQVVAKLNRIREASNKNQNKSETQSAEWDADTESITKVAELKKGFEQNQEEVETCDKSIEAWEQQIKELQSKITKAKECKDELQKLDQDKLAKEIQVGMHHVEKGSETGKGN